MFIQQQKKIKTYIALKYGGCSENTYNNDGGWNSHSDNENFNGSEEFDYDFERTRCISISARGVCEHFKN